MGQQTSTLCRPPKDSNLCRGNVAEHEKERCGLCTEYDGQGKDELRVHKVFDPRLDGLWFDDALLQDPKISTGDDSEKIRRRAKAARRRLFMPHVRHRFNDWYQMGRKLGDGASAEVYEASAWAVDSATGSPTGKSTRSVTSRKVAVKVFRLDQHSNSDKRLSHQEVKGQQEFFKAEWEMLAQLEHPHIVRMYECFREPSALYIVMECCHGGELIEYVKEVSRQRGRGGLEESGARNLFRQMLYAGSYLHASKIVHRDIKLENFLLVGASVSKPALERRQELPDVIKLCDFGTAVFLTDRAPRAYGRIGTLSYTSPEVCADKGATVLADAWSLGVVLYVLLVGAKPFRSKMEEPREETMRRIQMGAYNQARPGWKTVSAGSRDLVKQLITVEEEQRLGTLQALKHPWLVYGANGNSDSHDDYFGQPEPPESLENLTESAAGALRILSQATVLDPLQRFIVGLCARLTGEGELVRQSVWTTWYNLFFMLDANKDGLLDFAELARGIWAVLGAMANKPTAAELGSMVRAIDLNLSGAVEWNEWAAAALISTQNFTCKDELLATALRLIRRSTDDVPAEASLAEEFSPDGKNMEPVGRNSAGRGPQDVAPDSMARSLQVRELMASWINPQEDLISSLMAPSTISPSTPSVGLADLREVLRSTLWVSSDDKILTGSATPRTHSHPDWNALPVKAVNSGTQFPLDLAASPMPSPRGEIRQGHTVLQGPIVLPSARLVCFGHGSGYDSEPNSPRGLGKDDSNGHFD